MKLPLLRTWAEDGGPFLTLPLVLTEHPGGKGSNLGIYRMQRYDDGCFGLHFQIGKGGGFHLAEAESPRPGAARPRVPRRPARAHPGGDRAAPRERPRAPARVARARRAAAGLARAPGSRCRSRRTRSSRSSARRVRASAGPKVRSAITTATTRSATTTPCSGARRSGAAPIRSFPATVVGKPRQEDFYIGDYLQEMLSPLFPVVMPSVRALWSYGDTGFHSLAAAVVRERYRREAMMSAFRILGEGQLSLTKFLLVLDEARDLSDFKATLEHVLARADFRTDLYVFGNLSMDTLDYCGPKVNEGSKGVLIGVGDPIRKLPDSFEGYLPPEVSGIAVFCRGCLVLSGPPFDTDPDAAAPHRRGARASRDWPLLVLVDDAKDAASSVAALPLDDVHALRARDRRPRGLDRPRAPPRLATRRRS